MKTKFYLISVILLISWQLTNVNAQEPMLKGTNSWQQTVLFNVSQEVAGYVLPGNISGVNTYLTEDGYQRILIMHQFNETDGSPYVLENGLLLKGSRISYVDLDRQTQQPVDAGLPYYIVFDRHGNEVTSADQINESGHGSAGFDRFGNGTLFLSDDQGFFDDVMLFGEEAEDGTAYIMDLQEGELWAAPALGRGAFHQFAAIDVGEGKTGLIYGDGSPGSHVYLFIGEKNGLGDGSFLDQNGLATGKLYVWSGDQVMNSAQFHGTGNIADGSFFEITIYDPDKAGISGYDDQGYALPGTQLSLARLVSAFSFGGLRGFAVNPGFKHQIAFTDAGNGGADEWGTTYQIDLSQGVIASTLRILYDGDDAGKGQVPAPFFGIRSPRDIVWSDNGRIYIEEHKATTTEDYGGFLDLQSSVWELNPANSKVTRIGQINRKAIPDGLTDTANMDPGAWSPAGLLEATAAFDAQNNTTIFLAGINAGSVAGVDGASGQLLLLQGTNTYVSTETAMLTGLNGNQTQPLFTVGENPHGYTLTGVPDGIGVFERPSGQIRVLVNSKIDENAGGAYYLRNNLLLTGSRIWALDLNLVTRELERSSIGYQTIVDRTGAFVESANQINRSGSVISGLNNLSGGLLIPALHFGLMNDIFFAGESVADGTFYALDVFGETLYAIPAWGHATWKSVAFFQGQANAVSALLTLDRPDSPLLLWRGSPQEGPVNGFLNDNGLASGTLSVWVPVDPVDSGQLSGTNTIQNGTFVQIPVFQPNQAGTSGFDELGYAREQTILQMADDAGAYRFAHPGGLAVNPNNQGQIAMTTSGMGVNSTDDVWGKVVILDLDASSDLGTLTIVYDGDDLETNNLPNADFGLRNPGSVEWANSNRLYIQETGNAFNALFGMTSGQETSTWEFNPETRTLYRIARINRSARPFDLPDLQPATTGAWELGGIRDVSTNFTLPEESTLFLITVQAHTIQDSLADDYAEGGQLLFMAGQTIFDPSTGIQIPAALTSLQAFPNPLSHGDWLQVRIDVPEDARSSMALYDLMGHRYLLHDKILRNGPQQFSVRIPDHIPSGVYFLQMNSNKWLSRPLKLVIRP
ncbi:MAG: hypothetical protein R2806_08160 [Saprospiraceae bacterium]